MPGRRFCNNCFPYVGIFIVINFLSHISIIAIEARVLEYSVGKVGKQKSGHFSHSFGNLLTTPELHLLYFVFWIDFVTTHGPAGYEICNANTVLGFAIDHKLGIMQSLSAFASGKHY